MRYSIAPVYGPNSSEVPLAGAQRNVRGYLSQGRNSLFTPPSVDSTSWNQGRVNDGNYVGMRAESQAGASVFRKGLDYFASLGSSARQYFADGARELVSYSNLRGGGSLPYDRPAEAKIGGDSGFGPAISSLDL